MGGLVVAAEIKRRGRTVGPGPRSLDVRLVTTTTPMPCDATIQQKFSWDGSMFYAVDDLAPPGCGGGSGPPGSGANSSPSVNVATKPSTKTQGATVLVDPGIRETCPAGGSICSAAESARVPASVSAKTQKVLIGQAHFTVPAGTTAKLTFKLNSRGAKLLRKLKTLHMTVTVTSRVANSKPVSTTKQVTIKLPAAQHGH